MGSCLSAASEDGTSAAMLRHARIEKDLAKARQHWSQSSKILLLGAGDSGKTTVLKQMRVIHNMHWSAAEIESYRQIVFSNMILGLRALVDAVITMDKELSPDTQNLFSQIPWSLGVKEGEPFPPSLLQPLSEIWEYCRIQNSWTRCGQFALPDNILYFFQDLHRLFEPNYTPTVQDIIHCRARTTGINETIFTFKKTAAAPSVLHFVDVGGQKSERRKWIHCFQGVTAVLFLVSLSGYNQTLVEDQESNQMQDAMMLWDEINHMEWFKTTSMILFLNKNDLFREKVTHWPIKDHFSDFEGRPGDADAGRSYFKRRFIRLAMRNVRIRDKAVYVHYTTATDTAMLKVVMGVVSGLWFSDIGNSNLSKCPISDRLAIRYHYS